MIALVIDAVHFKTCFWIKYMTHNSTVSVNPTIDYKSLESVK